MREDIRYGWDSYWVVIDGQKCYGVLDKDRGFTFTKGDYAHMEKSEKNK